MKHISRNALAAVAAAALVGSGSAAPASAETARCFGERATITGTGFIEGTAGRDVIVATGDAEVHAHGGDDLVCGAFLSYGQTGDDRLRYSGDTYGGVLAGGPGDDTASWRGNHYADLTGGLGHDFLRAPNRGSQNLIGGPGPDVLRGGVGNDYLNGKGNNDIVRGGRGRDTLDGAGRDDWVRGGRGPDDLSGGRGTDRSGGGPGADTCSGFESGTC